MKPKFPVMAVVILIFALAWLFTELGYVVIKIPWLPTILVVLAIGMIFNRLNKN